MMKKFKLLILLVFLVLTSCVNVKDVRYLQPNAIIGVEPKPKLSAPKIAALITSKPVFKPPSV